MTFISKTQHADVVLIGGGIMSATLGAFLKQLEPNWTISLFEKLDEPGLESSGPWNNAGTGHAALCELNYSPAAKDGSVDPAKALLINEQFQLSRQFWSHLVTNGMIGSPKGFINTVPHMSFVIGEDNAKFLRTRYEALKPNPLFRSMEYSEDHAQIAKWAPLIVKGRDPKQRIAATRAAEGTDVDFGALTRELTTYLGNNGVEVNYGHAVSGIKRAPGGGWDLSIKHPSPANPGRSARSSSLSAPAAAPCTCSRPPVFPKSAASAGSRSAASSSAPTTRPRPSTGRRSMARPPSARRRCPFPTSTPARSTQSPPCSSARTPASARTS